MNRLRHGPQRQLAIASLVKQGESLLKFKKKKNQILKQEKLLAFQTKIQIHYWILMLLRLSWDFSDLF